MCFAQPRDIVVMYKTYVEGGDVVEIGTDYGYAFGKGNTTDNRDTVEEDIFFSRDLNEYLDYVKNKTGEWKLIKNDSILISLYTYKNNTPHGFFKLFDDNGSPLQSGYYKDGSLSVTDTFYFYYPAELKTNTVMCQLVYINAIDSYSSEEVITNKIINLWDYKGNKVVSNGRHYRADYFGEIKERIGLKTDVAEFETTEWVFSNNDYDGGGEYLFVSSWNKDSSNWEVCVFEHNIPVEYYYGVKEEDGKHRLFYIHDYEDKVLRIGEAKIHSCDSVLVKEYDSDGTVLSEKIINHVPESFDPSLFDIYWGCE